MADTTILRNSGQPGAGDIAQKAKEISANLYAEAVALEASEAYMGQAGTPGGLVEVNPVLDAGNAYIAGDVMAVPIESANFFRVNGGWAVLDSVMVTDLDDEGGAFDILFFRSQQAIGALNAALAMSDAESLELLGWVRVTAADYIDMGDQKMAFFRPGSTGWAVGILEGAAASRSLWVALVSRDTKTYTAVGDINLKLGRFDL